MAKAFGAVLRDYVIVSRYGGEEFLVIASQTDLEQGMLMAERARKHIETLTIPVGNGSTTGVTVSIGLTQFRDGETIETLISRADKGLYEAKESGRNKSVNLR